jgi:hypothetical protein
MKIDNNRKYPRIILSFIAIAVLVTMIALAPVVPSQQQQQQQQTLTQQTNTTASNQSAAAASSANITAADGEPGSVLKLSQANVALDIPLIKGYENGHEIFFIATDASDNKTAAMITNETGFKVNFAPVLAQTPEASRGQAYVFTNGIQDKDHLDFSCQL